MRLDLPHLSIIYIHFLIPGLQGLMGYTREFPDKMALILELTHFGPIFHFYTP